MPIPTLRERVMSRQASAQASKKAGEEGTLRARLAARRARLAEVRSQRLAAQASKAAASAPANRIASAKRAHALKVAKSKVAAAWVMAKALMPKANNDAQMRMASALLNLGLSDLATATRQAAKNASFTLLAEKFELEHGRELNEALEDPKVLEALKKEVVKELNTEDPLKTASKKKAAEGDDKKKEEDPPSKEEGGEEDEGGDDLGGADNGEGAGEDLEDHQDQVELGEAKADLEIQLQDTASSIKALEDQLKELDGQELDFSSIAEQHEEHQIELGGEESGEGEGEGDEFDFGPSSRESMQASLDVDLVDPDHTAEFFREAATADPMADLLTPGRVAEEMQEPDDVHVDAESDHEDSILGEVLSGTEEVEFEEDRESRPELRVAKDERNADVRARMLARMGGGASPRKAASGKKTSALKTIGDPALPNSVREDNNSICEAIFLDRD